MFPKLLNLYGLIAFILMATIPGCTGHSWVEEVRRIAQNGTLVGAPGFQRNHIGRGDPEFDGESIILRLLPPNGRPEGPVILETDQIANPIVQGNGYSDRYPMLAASPGDFVALFYQENGHVTLPQGQPNKPNNRGTIFVYGTTEPSEDDTLLGIHKQWTTDGTGGDGRGRLIATRNYDDGQCYEVNGDAISQERQAKIDKDLLRCQTDIRIPKDVPTGKTYTLYWVWDWPTLKPELVEGSENGIFPTQGDGVVTPQVYTCRIDIEVVKGEELEPPSDSNIANYNVDSSFNKFDESQSVRNRAIKAQLQNLFFVKVDDSEDGDKQSDPKPKDPSSETPSATSSTAIDATSMTTSTTSEVTESSLSSRNTVTVTATLDPTTIVVVVTETALPMESETSKVSKTVTVTGEPTTLVTVVTRTALRQTAATTDATASETTLFSAGRRSKRRANWAFGL